LVCGIYTCNKEQELNAWLENNNCKFQKKVDEWTETRFVTINTGDVIITTPEYDNHWTDIYNCDFGIFKIGH
jgi:hypothetical protein